MYRCMYAPLMLVLAIAGHAAAERQLSAAEGPIPGNAFGLVVSEKANPADQVEDDVGLLDAAVFDVAEETITAWNGVAPNLGGLYFRYEGETLAGIEMGGIASWVYISEADGEGVKTVLGRAVSNGTCNQIAGGAVQYENIMKKNEFTVVGDPLEERTAQKPIGSMVQVTDSNSEYCESGTVNKAKFTFVSSTDTTCTGPGGAGTPMDVQIDFPDFPTPPVGCVTTIPVAKDAKDQAPRPLYPDFVNKGPPPFNHGYFVSVTGTSANVNTPNGFTHMSAKNGGITASQGYFLTHECIDEWTARGVKERRALKSDGTFVWNRNCETIKYDPVTKIKSVWFSSTENVCPPANPGTEYNKLWSFKDYKLVAELADGPAIGPCTGGQGAVWVPEAGAPSEGPTAASATVGGAFGDSTPGPAPKPKPAPAPSAATTPVFYGVIVSAALAIAVGGF